MTESRHGDVILYAYLWAREHDRGEVSGRKDRPTCVMLIITGKDGGQKTLLFPITSRPPAASVAAVAVPETEARRAKLYLPAWVIVEEFNTDDLKTSWAVADREPLGRFSPKFMAKIAAAAMDAIRRQGARSVPRA